MPNEYGAHALKGATIDWLGQGLTMEQVMARGEIFSESVVRRHYARFLRRQDPTARFGEQRQSPSSSPTSTVLCTNTTPPLHERLFPERKELATGAEGNRKEGRGGVV